MSFIAQISGSALVNGLVWVVVIGLIFWLCWWLVGYFGLPEPFNKVVRCVLALLAVVFLINFLLSITNGHPFIVWK